jgi:large subunit ribosomal protein L6
VSRVGKNPIEIPEKVEVKLEDSRISVKGPKGELSAPIHPLVNVAVEDNSIVVTRSKDIKLQRALHGTTRANISNLVTGVTEGYTRVLEMVGVGFRAEMRAEKLLLYIGYSHPILFFPPTGITFTVEAATQFSVHGIDKQLVGQIAAKLRKLRPPEPYKGKGIKYQGEYIKRKAGKTAKA